MLEWMLMPLRRYTDFSGRSRRMEYWMFALLSFIISIVCFGPIYSVIFRNAMGSMDAAQDGTFEASAASAFQYSDHPLAMAMALLGALWFLFALIPSIAVVVRRLHDRDMSGWWYLGFIVISMIPIIGMIAGIGFLVLMFLPGTPGPNRFGPDPKGAGTDPSVFS